MSDTTRKQAIKGIIGNLVESNINYRHPKFRFATLFEALQAYYPLIYGSGAGKEGIMRFMEDITYAERMWRYATTGYNKEEKKILAQKFQINELGYAPNYHADVKMLKKII